MSLLKKKLQYDFVLHWKKEIIIVGRLKRYWCGHFSSRHRVEAAANRQRWPQPPGGRHRARQLDVFSPVEKSLKVIYIVYHTQSVLIVKWEKVDYTYLYTFSLIRARIEMNTVSGNSAFFSDWKPSVLILKITSRRNIFTVWTRGLRKGPKGRHNLYLSPLFALCKFWEIYL